MQKLILETLQKELRLKKALWEANENEISKKSESEKKFWLGYLPGESEMSLEMRLTESVKHHKNFLAEAKAVRAPVYPPMYDLRNVAGKNYITPIKNQGGCGSCVAFGTAATAEGTLRVLRNKPDLAVDYSEAQLFYCYAAAEGRNCSNGWFLDHAMNAFRDKGVVDEACFPYTAGNQPCHLCANAPARISKLSAWHTLNTVAAMKTWISTRGPLNTAFTVYQDFFNYHNGIYHHVSGGVVGGHCVCIVGYNDAQQCWIAKNSWGTGWGEAGFFRIGYGQCGIDAVMFAIDGFSVSYFG